MRPGKVELYINEILQSKGAMFFSLLDPVDYKDEESAIRTARDCARGGADIVLIGGSVGVQGSMLDSITKRIKEEVDVPVVLFPGNVATVTQHADAIYFLSVLNSRNPYWHVQAQMLAVPLVRSFSIEPLPVGYIVVAPGGTVGWVADINMVPREKPKIAAMMAMTGEYLGERIIVTDTGSNPQMQGSGPIPHEMIRAVKSAISVPYIVGGGIRSIKELRSVYASGADIAQIGAVFEGSNGHSSLRLSQQFSKVAKEEGAKKLRRM